MRQTRFLFPMSPNNRMNDNSVIVWTMEKFEFKKWYIV